MDQITIIKHIRDGRDLLSLPLSLSDVLKEAENPNFSAETLAKIILRDPVLTGRILKVANSSFYSRFSTITTVHQAVQLLGMNTVKCLALSTSILRPERIQQEAGIDVKLLFSSLLTAAAGADRLAKAVHYATPEEAFIAGLLHDIGLIYLLEHYPGQYRRILDKKVKATTLLDAEREIFGMDHAEVGYHIATRWRLPEHISAAIRCHHNVLSINEVNEVGRCVMLASLMAPASVSCFAKDLEHRVTWMGKIAASLSLTQQQIDTISSSMLTDSIEIAGHMDVNIGSTEEILTRANREIWHTYLAIDNLFKERRELTSKLLTEERLKGALEAKNVTIATLSHYLNNAAMAIYGRSQILRMMFDRGDSARVAHELPESLNVMDRSIKKMVAVLAEIRDILPMDAVKFIDSSQAIDIDDRIVFRLKDMEKESGLVLPDEVDEEIHVSTKH